MRQEIELYLGGKPVEFAEPPEILFSYIRTDYTDPTVLRNSYSKTLNIEGTPNNNQIFNGIYHLDKISDYGNFNPAKRMEFQLFSNGDILEQGYAKLDKINKEGKNISYDITLYGGLGEFLYNLSYDQTAEGSDTSRGGGEDRRLSSLIFYDATEPNKEFDFDITKDTVAEAWDALETGTGATKWKYINFAPAYNGYPDDFDSDTVLINTQNSTVPVTYNNNGTTGSTANNGGGFPSTIVQGDTTYRTYNNYALGKLPKDMTEWEMRDLRSYLQRPVMSMKGFINAVANPVNNGGYEVDLDPDFFNSSNPYYEKAWVTLPQLKKDEVETGQSAKTETANNILSVGSYMGETYDMRYYLQGLQPGATYQGIDLTFSFNTTMSGMPNEVYTTVYDYDLGLWGRDAGYYSSIFVQLIGEDANGNPIAASPIYNFTSPFGDEKQWWFIGLGKGYDPNQFCSRRNYGDAYTPTVMKEDVNMLGRFVKTSGNNYVWKSVDGNQSAFTVSLTDKLEYSQVYFRVTKCCRWRNYTVGLPDDLNCFEEQIFSGMTSTEAQARNILGGYVQNRELERCGIFGARFRTDTITAKTAVTETQIVGSQVKYNVVSDVVRSGDHISKGDLLNFDGTPCDYLLSYCKLFNLYLSKDTYDKKIYIRTRDSFYNGGTRDLDKFIDRSKEIKVSPLAMESRWYDFAYPEDEKCGAAEDYDFNYGVEYGKNKVQTTYEFDSSAVDLFSENIYQNGVQVQESSKYYTVRTVTANPRQPGGLYRTVPTYLYNSIEYELFATPNDKLNSCGIIAPTGYTQTGYTSNDGKEDWLPKLQLNNQNEPIDGTNVLCFFGGFKSSPYVGGQQAIYYLTDDVAEMYVVNGETPCWLWTKTEENGSQRIAKGMTKLPIFSRMLYDDTGNKIEYTWDFGRVRNTYVPVKNYVDKATIYERWWADYIADLYNANTRVVECYVKMEGKVVGDWLRAMYWWDNCYWVLTEINDYNITSYDTTRCKFVKVNDIANYTDGIIIPTGQTANATLVPTKYMIAASGETISAVVKVSDGGAWYLTYPSYVTPSVTAGTGDTTITLTFNSNPDNDGRDFNIIAYRGTVATPTHFWQESQGASGLTPSALQYYYIDYTGKTIEITLTLPNRGSGTADVSISYQSGEGGDWATLGPVAYNGDVCFFNVTVAPLDEEVETIRRAYVFVTYNGEVSTFYIVQFPYRLMMDPDGETRTFSGTGMNSEIYQTSLTSTEWLSVTKDNTWTAFITAPVNTMNGLRVSTITFSLLPAYGNTSAKVRVWQYGGGGSITIAPGEIMVDYNVNYPMIAVTSNLPWSLVSKPEWVSLPSSGNGGQTVFFATVQQNTGATERTGVITVTDGVRTASANITQMGRTYTDPLVASPANIYFNYTGDTSYISVNSLEAPWTLSSKPDWVILSQNEGYTGFTMVRVEAGQNPGSTTRTGNIIFTDGTHTATVAVNQPSSSTTKTLTLTPGLLMAENSGGTYQIQVAYGNRNGDDVTFTCSESWATIGYVNWTGETGTAIVTVQNYGVNAQRQATITATSILDSTLTDSITLKQKALPYINLYPSFIEYEQTGGTASIILESNTDWIIDITDTTDD